MKSVKNRNDLDRARRTQWLGQACKSLVDRANDVVLWFYRNKRYHQHSLFYSDNHNIGGETQIVRVRDAFRCKPWRHAQQSQSPPYAANPTTTQDDASIKAKVSNLITVENKPRVLLAVHRRGNPSYPPPPYTADAPLSGHFSPFEWSILIVPKTSLGRDCHKLDVTNTSAFDPDSPDSTSTPAWCFRNERVDPRDVRWHLWAEEVGFWEGVWAEAGIWTGDWAEG